MNPISIGLPVYNGEKYLAQSLESILAQTFSDFHLIIRDNASTDNTEDICREYADRDNRITYVRAEHNRGAAHNYNEVFRLASGRYFKWAAHDDLLAPDNLRQCYNYLETAPEVVLCYPRTVIIDREGRELKLYDDEMDLMQEDPVARLAKFWFNRASECNAVFGLIRSDILRNTRLIGPYNGSDNILLGQLALMGRVKELPDRLFFRRDHERTSLRANTTAMAVAAWFDPAAKGRVLPETRLTLEYVKIILAMNAGTATRARALKLLAKRTWWRKRLLLSEILKSAS